MEMNYIIKLAKDLEVGDRIVYETNQYVVRAVYVTNPPCCGRFEWGGQIALDVEPFEDERVPKSVLESCRKWKRYYDRRKKWWWQKAPDSPFERLLTYQNLPIVVIK